MIVCHCNVIVKAEVEASVRELLAEDPSACLAPQTVYKRLMKRGRCCGCFPTVNDIIETVLNSAISSAELAQFAAPMVEVEVARRERHEGQPKGYRTPE